MKRIREIITEKNVVGLFIASLAVSFLYLFITYSLNIKGYYYDDGSLFKPAGTIFSNQPYSYIAISLIIIFITVIILDIILVVQAIKKKNISTALMVSKFVLYFIPFVVLTFISFVFEIYSFSFLPLGILSLLLQGVVLVLFSIYNDIFKKTGVEEVVLKKGSCLIVDATSSLIALIIYFFPFLKLYTGEYYSLSEFFSHENDLNIEFSIDLRIISFVMFCLLLVSILKFVFTVAHYFSNNSKYIRKSLSLNNYNLAFSLIYFFTGYVYVFIGLAINEEISTLSYLPLIFMVGSYVVNIYLRTRVKEASLMNNTKEKKSAHAKIWPLVFTFIFTLITISSLLFEFVNFEMTGLGSYNNKIVLSGLDLLRDYKSLDAVYQTCAFVYYILIFTSVTLFVVSLIHYVGKTDDYFKVTKASCTVNVIFLFVLALIGLFLTLNQKLLDASVKAILEYFGLYISELYSYTIKSQLMYPFIISIIALIVMIFTGNYNVINFEKEGFASKSKSIISKQSNGNLLETDDFDPCPAFTDLDNKQLEFHEDLLVRKAKPFNNLTLPSLVSFVVQYARDSRLHLSYSYEDIAIFVAGLGTSRLSILQGMSGTGKTSLPKIFTEAIFGNCEIVEVESSWRDKNELLGYYNEFSRKYTPKKFTQCLYKAKLNPEIPTFIVLDEMNLSRIEYYFSDFLSLMEAEEHKRELKLLNIKIYPNQSEKTDYVALKDGSTIEIPTNVWFVGTANRDESTFEISDKVYDRAQTMNFTKRALKVQHFQEEMAPQFVSYKGLEKLFIDAKNSFAFDAENDYLIQEVEKLLAPYNISFGNRVLKQMEEFVKIYCACYQSVNFDNKEIIRKAVENILFSKVISKLEYKQLDNKAKLAAALDKLQLYKCSAFVKKLLED